MLAITTNNFLGNHLEYAPFIDKIICEEGSFSNDFKKYVIKELDAYNTGGGKIILFNYSNSNMDKCETDPETALHQNSSWPIEIFKHIAKNKQRLLYVSTGQVYGSKEFKVSEQDTPSPLSIYALSKLLAENSIREVCPSYTILRLSSVYGPTKSSNVFKQSCDSFLEYVLKRKDKEIVLVRDICNNPIYIKDALYVLNFLGQALVAGPKRNIFNLGGPDVLDQPTFASLIAHYFEFDLKTIPVTKFDMYMSGIWYAPRLEHNILNSSKLYRKYNVGRKRESVEDVLEELYTEYKAISRR